MAQGKINKKPKLRFNVKTIFFTILAVFFVLSAVSSYSDYEQAKYPQKSISTVLTDVKKGKVKKLEITDSEIQVTYKNKNIVKTQKEVNADIFTMLKNANINPLSVEIENKNMSAILQGTLIAFRNKKIPFMTVELDDISPRELGAFLQWKMIEMMYLAQLLNVNCFDQPAVEEYKKEARRLLTLS